MSSPRVLLAGGVLVVAVGVGVLVVVAGGSGSDGGRGEPARTVRARLTLERSVQPDAGYQEAVVSLPDERLNSLATTRGARSVLLRCFDRDGRLTVRQDHDWPLVEELGYPPHIHQPAASKVLDRLRSCRLTGTGIAFAGRVTRRLPPLRPPG